MCFFCFPCFPRFLLSLPLLPPLPSFVQLAPIGSTEEQVMVAGSGRNMAKTLRENSSTSSSTFAPSPFNNTTSQRNPGGARFEVDLTSLDVGDLCTGGVYKCSLTVTNRGQSIGRFRIGRRGTPSNNGDNGDNGGVEPGCDSVYHKMRVIYNPGPIAAGMSRKLDVEIAALSANKDKGGASVDIDDYVEVVASEQVLRIPVYGKVVDATRHDRRRVGKQATLVSKMG